MARNLEEARQALLRALDVGDQERVLLPANATHDLVETVKRSGAKPIFGNVDRELQGGRRHHLHIAWSQPPLGLPIGDDLLSECTVLDHGDSLPLDRSDGSTPSFRPDVSIFGLHLSSDPRRAGALLVFNNEALVGRYMSESGEVEPGVYTRAAIQLERLQTIGRRQERALKMVSIGLQAAAGLPVPPVLEGAALAHGVAVRIPDECSPSTFWAYASGENTPVEWLPTLRPIHYAAALSHPQTATDLERWIVVPVAPDNDEETIRQAVLGIVNTAEYLGIRWRTDPARAAHYAALLDAMYGAGHDAYRPAFSIDAKLPAEATFCAAEVIGPSCRI